MRPNGNSACHHAPGVSQTSWRCSCPRGALSMEPPKQGPTDWQVHSLIPFNQDHRKEGLKDLLPCRGWLLEEEANCPWVSPTLLSSEVSRRRYLTWWQVREPQLWAGPVAVSPQAAAYLTAVSSTLLSPLLSTTPQTLNILSDGFFFISDLP